MKLQILLVSILTVCIQLKSDVADHLKPCKNKSSTPRSSVRNVDFIYVISLDKRSNRWKNVQRQLSPYGIYPYRFSAVHGWDLSTKVLNDIGVLYKKGMQKCPYPSNRAAYFLKDFSIKKVDLDETCYGKKYISHYFTRGAIGCFLSHLSVLADAYKAGYNTIWVMEDDIIVKKNPHQISNLIDELNRTVGKNGWDLLYTEEGYFPGFNAKKNKDLPKYQPSTWRPDINLGDTSYLVQHDNVGKHFLKVGLKKGTRSMIIQRQGIKKILDYALIKGIFLPIDVELAFIPSLNKFTVKKNVVASGGFSSDTRTHNK